MVSREIEIQLKQVVREKKTRSALEDFFAKHYVSDAFVQGCFWAALGCPELSIEQLDVFVQNDHISLLDNVKEHWTPCVRALTYQQPAQVQWLCEHDMWFCAETKVLALKQAIRFGHAYFLQEAVVRQKIDISDTLPELLQEAVVQHQHAAFELMVTHSMLSHHEEIRQSIFSKALYAAAAVGGNLHLTKWLCETYPGMDIFHREAEALRWAAHHGHVCIVQFLLESPQCYPYISDTCRFLEQAFALQHHSTKALLWTECLHVLADARKRHQLGHPPRPLSPIAEEEEEGQQPHLSLPSKRLHSSSEDEKTTTTTAPSSPKIVSKRGKTQPEG